MRRTRDSVKNNIERIARLELPGQDPVLITADELTEYCKKNNISPRKLRTYCPGCDFDRNKCSCRVLLCSWQEQNIIKPYFAHRDGDKTAHIEDCDAEDGIQNVIIRRTIDFSFSQVNINEITSNFEFEIVEPKPKIKEADEGEIEENDKLKDIIKVMNSNNNVEIVAEYTPIQSLADLYYAIICALRTQNDGSKRVTKDGYYPEDIIVNSDTIDMYRTGKKDIEGIKMALISLDPPPRTVVQEIQNAVGDKDAIITVDPFDSDTPIYFAISVVGSRKKHQTYTKKVEKLRASHRCAIVFGYMRKMKKIENINNKPAIVVAIDVEDAKAKQIFTVNKFQEKNL